MYGVGKFFLNDDFIEIIVDLRKVLRNNIEILCV